MYTVADPRQPTQPGDEPEPNADGHPNGHHDGPAAGNGQASPPVVVPGPPVPPPPTSAPAAPEAANGQATPTVAARRVVEHIDVWSVLKVSTFFFASLAAVCVLASAILWIAANVAGVVANVEGFMSELGFKDFHFNPFALLQAALLAGMGFVVLGVGTAVLATLLYNLISDLVGGVEILEVERRRRFRRRRHGESPDAVVYRDPARHRGDRGYSSVG